MLLVFKFAYQNWNTMTKEDEQAMVKKGAMTKEDYKDIVGEPYPENENSNENSN